MSEIINNKEYQSTPEQTAIEAWETLQNISPEQTQNTNNELQKTTLAQKAEKIQEAKNELPEQTLNQELSWENKSQLNQLSKQIAQDAISQLQANFDANNTDPNAQFSILQQRYNILESIAQNPDIQSKFPNFVQAVQELVQIKYTPTSISEQFAKITNVQKQLETSWVYLNFDFMATWGEFCMDIQWKAKPQEAVLGTVFTDWNLSDKIQPCIILWNDPEFNKKWYAFDGKTYLNPWAVENAIDLQVQNGRFTEGERAWMNVENINLATINHEEAHRLLGEIYKFPKWYQEIPADQINDWSINWVPFQPQNYTQIDEFIAHSIGQQTDSYETIENIAQWIWELNIDENGNLEYKQNPNSPESKAYWLLRAFVMEEVAKIIEEKWILNFKELLLEKRTHTPVNQYNIEYNRLQSELEAAKQIPWNSEQVKELTYQFLEHDSKWDEVVDQNNKVWNTTTRDIVQLIGESWLQRINQKCLEQSQKYMAIIEQKFPKKENT